MQYGYFDNVHKEYVITRPDTPTPWINYLGGGGFSGLQHGIHILPRLYAPLHVQLLLSL